jgi:hypothetical protein
LPLLPTAHARLRSLFAPACPGLPVMRQSVGSADITSLQDLRGKSLGISGMSGGAVLIVRGAMAAAGLADGVDSTLVRVGEGGQAT